MFNFREQDCEETKYVGVSLRTFLRILVERYHYSPRLKREKGRKLRFFRMATTFAAGEVGNCWSARKQIVGRVSKMIESVPLSILFQNSRNENYIKTSGGGRSVGD